MTVSGLYLENFRNYKKTNIIFSDGVNIISGKNAQGKTNLIEALYYLAAARSFRNSSDKDLINFDSDTCCVRAEIISAQRKQTLQAEFRRGQRRRFTANGVKLKSAGELTGKLTAVVFCPDDLCIIKDGASLRRKLMDNAISQLRPAYADHLSEFNKLYEHKTRILRDHFEKPSLLELIDDFNTALAKKSADIIYYRAAYVTKLSSLSEKIHNNFTNGREVLKIKYKTAGDIETFNKKPSDLLKDLLEHQKKHKEAEIRSGLCLSGAHKDDLEIEINGKTARKYASQGQARTACVTIKLAERDIFFNDRTEYPVLLLDDVLSELDEKRQQFILNSIGEGQVFITCCDDNIIKKNNYNNIYTVEDGKCKIIGKKLQNS